MNILPLKLLPYYLGHGPTAGHITSMTISEAKSS